MNNFVNIKDLKVLKDKVLLKSIELDTDIFIPSNMLSSYNLMEIVKLPKKLPEEYNELNLGQIVLVLQNQLISLSDKAFIRQDDNFEYFLTNLEAINCFI